MIKNYLKIAWRNLVKNKTHSLINIAGLSAGRFEYKFVDDEYVKKFSDEERVGRLAATVFNLWGLLPKNFVVLVVISFLIATPVAYYLMHKWLQNYDYHTELAWWIFSVTAFGTIIITLATVSYQSIMAALANPVKSLRRE